MLANNESIIPVWPENLQHVDVVKLRFVLDFMSPCALQPADFLGLGRILKVSGRQLLDVNDAVAVSQWEALFQPPLSHDPVALRKYQKPAPAFVVTMPILEQRHFDIGEHLNCEVLFIGTGIPLIHVFLRTLIHLGRLGLVAGEGHFDVTEVYSVGEEESLVWRHGEPVASLPCTVLPLNWLLRDRVIGDNVTLNFITPTRLIVDRKPLRNPRFSQIFPFMLRRVTSMLHAHAGIEQHVDVPLLIDVVRQVNILESKLVWQDWRKIGQQGMVVGGFVGEIAIDSQYAEEFLWVLAVTTLFGVGKGATYGAGQVSLLS